MQDSDELLFTCPCCSSTLGLDDAGDLYAIEDTREGNVGIGGIRVTEAAGNDWKQRQYMESEPKRYEPPLTMIAGIAGKHNQPVEADPELLKANAKDWDNKNIRTESNDGN